MKEFQIQQISVYLANKPGRLAEVAKILKDNKINIRVLTIAEDNEKGILRMIVNKPDEALTILKEKFMSELDPMIAVPIDDHDGLLYEIVDLCDRNKLNINYMYSFVDTRINKAIMFMRFGDKEVDHSDEAVKMFTDARYKLLSFQEAYNI